MYRIKTIIVIVLIMAFAVTVYSFRKQEDIFIHHNQSSSLPEYEIVWYHANAPQKETKLVMDKVNKYLKQKINAKLRLKLIDNGDYDNVLKAAISSGEKFDICFTSVWMNSYVHNALKGSFKELSPLLEKYGKGIVKAMPKVLLEGARVNGKIYALPSIKEPGHQWCILINKKYADKYDFDLTKVSKLQDLDPMFRIIKQKEKDVIPYLIYANSCHEFSLPIERIDEQVPIGLYYDNRTRFKLVNALETPEFKEYAYLMHKWYSAGFILRDAAAIKSAEDIDESGKWFAGSASYTPKTEAEASHKLGYAVKAIPIREPFITKKDTEFHMEAISSTSGNPERAMMFLNLLYTDPYLYNLIAYGIEGKHYEKRASGVIEKPGNAYFVEPCTFGNSNLSYNLSYYPKNLKEELKSLNTKAIISPLLKFSFNPDKVESEIEKITDVTEEIEGPLFTGTVDPDAYLPKIIDKYKKAGLDKVMLEMQRQLDNWNSNRK